MKQLYTFIFFLFGFFSLSAQIPSTTQFSGLMNNKFPIAQFSEKNNTSANQYFTISVYSYPITDQPTSISAVAFDGSKYNDHFTYINGNVDKIRRELWANNSWNDMIFQTSHYNTDGFLDTLIQRQFVNLVYWDSLKYAYNYDASNNVISSVENVWSNNQWTPDIYYQYNATMDVDTVELIIQRQMFGDDNWENLQKMRLFYNANGKVELQEVFAFNANNWIKQQRIVSTYNADGREATSQVKAFVSNLLDTKYTYVYSTDQSIKLQNIIVDVFYNNSWINNYVVMTYNYNGNAAVATDKDNTKNYVKLIQQDLQIYSTEKEFVSIYSATGSLIYQFEKNAGMSNYTISEYKGMLIVKGSSGWVNKIMSK